ncbi:MAG TPA: permease prefix domain 1-containing protein, partial [Microbacteriaceae bacterium]|nr:permease prefix domain 1-containing protein [Microbacteriaceae bacterium]
MSGDPIDAYIEALARRLVGSTIQVHRTLLEVEDHLRESQSALMVAGADADAAANEAVAQFGSVSAVASGLNGHSGTAMGWARARGLLGIAAQLG